MRTMARMLVAGVVGLVLLQDAVAGPFGLFRRGGTSSQPSPSGQTVQQRPALWTAQDSANYQASICRMGHFGNPSGGFEGVGMAGSAEAAINNTCRPWFGGQPRDVGVAQGRDGKFYACRRW